MIGRRALLAAPAALAAGTAGAQTAPLPGARPASITLLVGAAAGSATDLWVRGFAPFLERHLKQVQVAVSNRPDEGGFAALRALAGAAPDGATLAYVATPFHLARAVEYGAVPLLDRIALLGAVVEEPVFLLAPPGTELEALRARPQLLALPPPASAAAICAAGLTDLLPMEEIHFPSAAAARQAAAAGNVAATLLSVSEAVPAIREGRLVPLAVAAPARHPQWPDIPTFREAGLPLDAALRRGIAAPAGLAAGPAAAITRALRAAVADPEFLAQAESRGALPVLRDRESWSALAAQDLVELRHRWDTAPWPRVGR